MWFTECNISFINNCKSVINFTNPLADFRSLHSAIEILPVHFPSLVEIRFRYLLHRE